MKLISYSKNNKDQLAILVNDKVYDTDALDKRLPDNMRDFLWAGESAMNLAKELEAKIRNSQSAIRNQITIDKIKLLAPVPFPTSCRDGYAFRQHVASARKNRGVEMIPEFDQYPIFYFTNHNAITGEGDVEFMPDHFQQSEDLKNQKKNL